MPYAIGNETRGPRRDRAANSARSRILPGWSKPPPTHGLEIALDLAIPAAPDHPGRASIRTGSTMRPDGSIRYAENPPKRYEDIYPVNFGSPIGRRSGNELKRSCSFGLIAASRYSASTIPTPNRRLLGVADRRGSRAIIPDVIFLSEAFTRPKVMKSLAKAGFTQSYLLHLAQLQGTRSSIFHGAHADRSQRIHARESLPEHARYPAGMCSKPAAGRHSRCG